MVLPTAPLARSLSMSRGTATLRTPDVALAGTAVEVSHLALVTLERQMLAQMRRAGREQG